MEYNSEMVMCPLIDKEIEPMNCVDVVDCILNPKFLENLPDEYKVKKDFINICKQCKWHCY